MLLLLLVFSLLFIFLPSYFSCLLIFLITNLFPSHFFFTFLINYTIVSTHFISSRITLPHHILSYLIISYLILSILSPHIILSIQSNPILSHIFTLSHSFHRSMRVTRQLKRKNRVSIFRKKFD